MNPIFSAGFAQPQGALAPPPSGDNSAGPTTQQGGMFAAAKPKRKLDVQGLVMALSQAYLASRASHGDRGAEAMLPGIQQQMLYRMKQREADKQTAGYVDALVARGMDPNEAQIIAADPGEMAKHFGTRYDAATIDEGSSRYTPNLNGTANVFTAPKTFQNKADVVQMPGTQAVAMPYEDMSAGGAPMPIGAPASIPGLRTEGQQYASGFGLQPGTPAYNNALQDYELKGDGPTAFGHDSALQTQRLGSQAAIAAARNAVSAANNIRTTTTHRDIAADRNHTQQGIASDRNQTQRDVAAGHDRTHLQTARKVREVPNEPVAVGPHGERLVVRNGAWVDSATGKPVR